MLTSRRMTRTVGFFIFTIGVSLKPYLQCFLSLELLHGRGLLELLIKQMQTLYKAVLVAPDPTVVVPDRSEKDNRFFKKSVALGKAASALPAPAPAPMPLPSPLPGADSDASDCIVDDEDVGGVVTGVAP